MGWLGGAELPLLCVEKDGKAGMEAPWLWLSGHGGTAGVS